MSEDKPIKDRIIGLTFWQSEHDLHYDVGRIAYFSMEALRTAVLAIEQVVTGEKLCKSIEIADFYSSLNMVLEEINGEGVQSESGDMGGVQGEIDDLMQIVQEARRMAKQPGSYSRKGPTCTACDGSGRLRRVLALRA